MTILKARFDPGQYRTAVGSPYGRQDGIAGSIVIPARDALAGLRQNRVMSSAPRQDISPGVSEPIVLLISRREVEQADLLSVLSRLKVLLATREDAWRCHGQMTLVVDGHNHDPRELVDIPEVRTLLRRLEAEWPYWAFFFN